MKTQLLSEQEAGENVQAQHMKSCICTKYWTIDKKRIKRPQSNTVSLGLSCNFSKSISCYSVMESMFLHSFFLKSMSIGRLEQTWKQTLNISHMQKQGTVRDMHKGNYLIYYYYISNLTEMVLKTANEISENVPKKISCFFQKRSTRSTNLE